MVFQGIFAIPKLFWRFAQLYHFLLVQCDQVKS